ncbi:MAG: endonuclease III domain-containing protein, partial [Myxococcaceae bacterium]
YRDARALAEADTHELESMIHSCGFFRAKAKALKGMAAAVAGQHGGEVPIARAELAALPGVGPKTAGVVTVHLGGEPAFPVDTHVKRLSRRLGFTKQEDPSRIEEDLQALVPSGLWGKGHQLLVWHGRRTCFARSPACERCVVRELCPRIGVAKAKATVVKGARLPRHAAVVPPAPGRRGGTRRKPRSGLAAR